MRTWQWKHLWLGVAFTLLLQRGRVDGFFTERVQVSTRIRTLRSFQLIPSPSSRSTSSAYASCLLLASLQENSEENNKREEQKPTDEIAQENSSGNETIREDVDLLIKRVTQLEHIVAMQEVELVKLRRECDALTEATSVFAHVVEMLRDAGLDKALPSDTKKKEKITDVDRPKPETTLASVPLGDIERTVEYYDTEIFGSAPKSVIDAADGAGAAILAGLLGGKQRMLVDVRDAELSRDQETLVQFVELAILPVAAGLEGLKSRRNRVKIVFPTVSQLLDYRKTMALAAPEVVSLSTLGFEPIEKRDNLVVLVAPAPDDEEGLAAMNELLAPSDPSVKPIRQPLVVINHHMVPVQGPAADFEVAYHLRLLSVQYMSGDAAPEFMQEIEDNHPGGGDDAIKSLGDLDDDALEAAMKHAHEIGMNQGVTRAMVIRAYPK